MILTEVFTGSTEGLTGAGVTMLLDVTTGAVAGARFGVTVSAAGPGGPMKRSLLDAITDFDEVTATSAGATSAGGVFRYWVAGTMGVSARAGYGVVRKVINPSCFIWCQASLGGSVQDETVKVTANPASAATEDEEWLRVFIDEKIFEI
jgi:hypothetical protein